jgi:hypothetical protein
VDGSVEEGRQVYRDRLALVGRALGVTLPEKEKKSTAFAMSVPEMDLAPSSSLPASAGFIQCFEEYIGEVRASEGSKRAKAHPGFPMDVGKFPARFNPKMSFYNIQDCPWKQAPAPADHKLLDSSLYGSKYPPSIRVDQAKVQEWEASNREVVSVASHMDWFVSATVAILDGVKSKLEEGPVDHEAWQDIWNDASDATDLLTSVGKGLQDIVKCSVSEVGSLLLVRRDSWLEHMKTKVSKEDIFNLRAGSLNKDTLFGASELVKAQEAADQNIHGDFYICPDALCISTVI